MFAAEFELPPGDAGLARATALVEQLESHRAVIGSTILPLAALTVGALAEASTIGIVLRSHEWSGVARDVSELVREIARLFDRGVTQIRVGAVARRDASGAHTVEWRGYLDPSGGCHVCGAPRPSFERGAIEGLASDNLGDYSLESIVDAAMKSAPAIRRDGEALLTELRDAGLARLRAACSYRYLSAGEQLIVFARALARGHVTHRLVVFEDPSGILTSAQLQIWRGAVELLAARHNAIVVVGEDAPPIGGFREVEIGAVDEAGPGTLDSPGRSGASHVVTIEGVLSSEKGGWHVPAVDVAFAPGAVMYFAGQRADLVVSELVVPLLRAEGARRVRVVEHDRPVKMEPGTSVATFVGLRGALAAAIAAGREARAAGVSISELTNGRGLGTCELCLGDGWFDAHERCRECEGTGIASSYLGLSHLGHPVSWWLRGTVREIESAAMADPAIRDICSALRIVGLAGLPFTAPLAYEPWRHVFLLAAVRAAVASRGPDSGRPRRSSRTSLNVLIFHDSSAFGPRTAEQLRTLASWAASGGAAVLVSCADVAKAGVMRHYGVSEVVGDGEFSPAKTDALYLALRSPS